MKYTYVYKSSDGVRHEAEMKAESREAVFSTLRQEGIKPIKVIAADGSKANGEIRGIRRRVLVAVTAGVAIVAGLAAFWLGRGIDDRVVIVTTPKESAKTYSATALARQAIVGDRLRVEKLPKDFFKFKAKEFLARFAEPGRPFDAPETDWPTQDEFMAALNEKIQISETDFTEWIDLKRIVTGMEREMSAYLHGGGSVNGYIRELIARQNTEIKYREEAQKKLSMLLRGLKRGEKPVSAYDFWLKSNARLQSMGIYSLPLPDELRDRQVSFDDIE